ncbi:MAG: uracil-DNA glycosylase [Selenomonadaceae bacterium]|nr:uracil-DNA glycosylase [Selenomonadaceae bacterium]
MQIFKNDWAKYLDAELQQPYYRELRRFLIGEYRTRTIYPDMYSIFNALHYTAYEAVKAVILGQDPYHERGQAHGLSFSVQEGVEPPPSLMNIFKELRNDVGCAMPDNGCLKSWADQGVLLLNAVLTVREHQANSHQGKGWERFTDRIIELLNARERPIAFVLWGNYARQKKRLITSARHLIIESAHPSPLSAHRGFFGSRPFSRVNEFLLANGETAIDWQIPNVK